MSASAKPSSPRPDLLLPSLEELTADEMISRRDVASRLVEDDGVVVGTDDDGQPRPLELDPLPLVLGAAEWSVLGRGLEQRAVLLDALLADLYGDRALVSAGLVPAELVIGHPGFLPQADGIPTRHKLFLTAADLGRAADGSWRVVADRTQSPVGAGYAMATRRIIARTLAAAHRENDLRRLRGFFDLMRAGFLETASDVVEAPRVVLLASPESAESAFDEVITATLLGFPLVSASDLAMRRGQLWLNTTEKPEPVDVVVRRVSATVSDPLDLTGGGGGVPGLVEATRRGAVTVVNPIGAGVLENPALAAYLPRIAEHLLGEELLLPSVGTWWCGDPAAWAYVRDHLDDLELRLVAMGGAAAARIRPAGLAAADREALITRVGAQPWAWCAQEVLPDWTISRVTDAGLEQRPALLRTFTVAGPRGAATMPGGIARLAPETSPVPTLAQAVAKDVWVLRDDTESAEGAAAASDEAEATRIVVATPRLDRPVTLLPLPPQAAEDLYWFGRYAERAESTARLLRVADDLAEDHLRRRGTAGHLAMRALIDAIDGVTSVHRDRRSARVAAETTGGRGSGDPLPHLRGLVFDARRRGTVRYSSRRAARAAAQVRELLSGDTWLVLSRLERTLGTPKSIGDDLQSVLASVIESLLALAGIAAEGLVRDAIWAFFDMGRRIERSQETVRILRATVTTPRPPKADRLVLEAVLTSRESIISHRRRLVEGPPRRLPLAVALDLLLTDPTNPRAVRFQLDRLREDLRHAPAASVFAALDEVEAHLTAADWAVTVDDRQQLADDLQTLERGLRDLSAAFDRDVLRHRAPPVVQEGPR